MNPFLSITRPEVALVAHQRLAFLESTVVTAKPDDDEAEASPALRLPGQFAWELYDGRIYRPKGKTLACLRAMQEHGTMTAAALARVIGSKSESIPSLLEIVRNHCIVVRVGAGLWRLA